VEKRSPPHAAFGPPPLVDYPGDIDSAFDARLAAAREGAEWAIAELWRDLHPRLLAYFRTGAPGAAEDLASETWIDLARGMHRFSGGEADFRRFTFTIARRRLIDHRRKAARRRTDPAPAAAFATRASMDDPAARVVGDDALAVIGRLPPDQAEVIVLRVVGGLSAAEVGRVLGKNAGAIRVLQHRGLRRLAEMLGEV
jgi:RNA polymerase sigma-70 factor (ECF subfamily)